MSINPTSYTCHICLEPVTIPEGETISSIKKEELAFTGTNALSESMDAIATTCDHLFHESCLKDWIKEFEHKTRAATCPACRTELMPPAVPLTQPVPYREQPIAQNVHLPFAIDHLDFQPLMTGTPWVYHSFPQVSVYGDEDEVFLDTHQEVNFSLEPILDGEEIDIHPQYNEEIDIHPQDGEEIDIHPQTRFYLALGVINQVEFPITNEQIEQLRPLARRATLEQIMEVGRLARSLGNTLLGLGHGISRNS